MISSKESNIQILIAGRAGFIGANLCRYCLDCGYSVICVDNLSSELLENPTKNAPFVPI